jgi:hypothetical protein
VAALEVCQADRRNPLKSSLNPRARLAHSCSYAGERHASRRVISHPFHERAVWLLDERWESLRSRFNRLASGETRLGSRPRGAQIHTNVSELSGRVIQRYIYRWLVNALQAKGFVTVSEERGADDTIRLAVRRHEG